MKYSFFSSLKQMHCGKKNMNAKIKIIKKQIEKIKKKRLFMNILSIYYLKE